MCCNMKELLHLETVECQEVYVLTVLLWVLHGLLCALELWMVFIL